MARRKVFSWTAEGLVWMAILLLATADGWTQSRKSDRGIQVRSTASPSPEWGNYYALIIGINVYREWTPLQTAVNDARALRDILLQQYGFAGDGVLLRMGDQATLS